MYFLKHKLVVKYSVLHFLYFSFQNLVSYHGSGNGASNFLPGSQSYFCSNTGCEVGSSKNEFDLESTMIDDSGWEKEVSSKPVSLKSNSLGGWTPKRSSRDRNCWVALRLLWFSSVWSCTTGWSKCPGKCSRKWLQHASFLNPQIWINF